MHLKEVKILQMNCLLKPLEKYNLEIAVSNDGKVYHKKRLLKTFISKEGYERVKFSVKSKIHRELIHRLVAEAFIPNPENKPVVNHIDGNKQNNCVENLEWCTTGENLHHAFLTGLRNCEGVNNPMTKLSQDEVDEIRRTYVKGKHCEFNSRGLAKKYGVCPGVILNIIHGRTFRN